MKTKYRADFPERAKKLAEEELLDEQIWKQLGIKKVAFYDYQKKYPNFANALKEGKRRPNEEVEAARFKRAVGYETQEVIAVPMGSGEDAKARVVRIVRKHVPGDVTEQIFWLKNRVREKWRDAREVQAQVSPGVPRSRRTSPRRTWRS
jgi:hypothetical protein